MDYEGKNSSSQPALTNLTALWAFSEAFLGGILHALKLPFKGLIVGSIAVFIITIMANFTYQKGVILKAGIISIMVKAMLSPHTPPTAYLSVFLQALMGEALFWKRSFMTLTSILLGILTSVFSSLQRVIILTLIFGETFWETIDKFSDYIYKELLNNESVPPDFKLSYWLIGFYVGIHVIVGFFAGLFASRIARKIKSEEVDRKILVEEIKKVLAVKTTGSILHERKRKRKWIKIWEIFIYAFLITILILSYVINDKSYFDPKSLWIMLVRSVLILILWFKVFSPVMQRLLRSKIMKNKSRYFEDVESVMNIFPFIKQLVKYAWKTSRAFKGLKKVSGFAIIVLTILLNYNFRTSEFIEI